VLRERAYAAFKRRLFEGEFRPGQFLSQRELAEAIRMPIAPVRDALKRLQVEALVRVIPQRGVQIADVNARLLREAFELRTLLEIHAIRRWARHADPARLDALEATMRSIGERAAQGFSAELGREFIRADFAFHEALFEGIDNELVAEVYRVNSDRIRLAQLTNRLNAERLRAAVGEHLEILAALRAGDGDAAAAALERHLAAVLRKIMGGP
jgi:DNA-binding GntR family transcriptional regulator